MKKERVVLFGVLLILSLSGRAQKSDSLIAKPQLLNQKTYSMLIPLGWKIMDNCVENLCSLLSPTDTLSYIDSYVENINFTVQPLPSASYSAEQYLKFSQGYLPKVVKGFKVISKQKLKSNVSLLIYSGEKSGFKQTWKQYYYVKNKKVFIVTFACETTKYDYYLPLVESSLASFRLK